MFHSIDAVLSRLAEQQYFADRDLATNVFLAARLRKPILVEGDPGAGKTELARALARALDTECIRLQCYEGLGEGHALFEWNHAKQLLRIRLGEAANEPAARVEREIFSKDYLVKRPLIEAFTWEGPAPPVLLIDRIDRADEETEAFLQGVLSDLQVTVPGMGIIRPRHAPLIVVTSNRARPIDPALKRCCLYSWIACPGGDREYAILIAKVPAINRGLARQICNLMQRLRAEEFARPPGVAEALDWGRALTALRRTSLDADVVNQTAGCLFKQSEDILSFRRGKFAEFLRPGLDRVG